MAGSSLNVIDNDILSRAVEAIEAADLKPVAQALAAVRLPTSDLDRVDELLGKKGDGGLTEAEAAELQSYLRVGIFLDMIRARAVRILFEEERPIDG